MECCLVWSCFHYFHGVRERFVSAAVAMQRMAVVNKSKIVILLNVSTFRFQNCHSGTTPQFQNCHAANTVITVQSRFVLLAEQRTVLESPSARLSTSILLVWRSIHRSNRDVKKWLSVQQRRPLSIQGAFLYYSSPQVTISLVVITLRDRACQPS